MSEHYFSYNEIALLSDSPVKIIRSKTSSFPSGAVVKSYQVSSLTENKIISHNGEFWIKESDLKKIHTSSDVSFKDLMNILKNDVIQKEDFE